MERETKGLGAGSYPEPKEIKDKNITAKVLLTFDLHYSIPENWDAERIFEDIKENLNDFEWYDVEIQEIEVEND